MTWRAMDAADNVPTMQPMNGVRVGEDAVGVIEGIYLAGAATETPTRVERAEAVAGAGLAGDRYAAGTGTYSSGPKPGRQVTLIEAEALDELASAHGLTRPAAGARRNIVTRGVSLSTLIGCNFTIGAVELVGVRDCPPCAHLEKLTGLPLRTGLAGRGGLRADVVRSGTLAVGDRIVPLDVGQLAAHLVEAAPQQAGNVHLADAENGGDVGLAALLDEPHAQDLPLAGR
jgi:MOSC domain-containing protein YiiM